MDDTGHSYRLYGLRVTSDVALPELLPATGDESDTIRLRRASVPADAVAEDHRVGAFCRVSEDALLLEVPDIARFLVRDGKTVDFEMAKGASEDSVRLFLLGSCIGAILFQRGHMLLHGNAFEVGDGCVICVGPSGAGKSTLAAAMMARGHRIVADDVCPIDADGFVIPGMPRLKLWQDSARQMEIETDGLARIRPELAKFNLPLGEAFRSEPAGVKAVYVLSPWNEDHFEIEEIDGLRRFQVLRNNTYRYRYMSGMGGAPEHLKQCAALAPRVAMARIQRPRADFRIDELCDAILADLERRGLAS